MRKHYFKTALILLLLIFFAKAFTAIQTKSATWDETHYFAVGKYLLEGGDFDVRGAVLHPPLMYYWHSIPLLFMDIEEKHWDKLWQPVVNEKRSEADIMRGQVLLSSKINTDDYALNKARAIMIFAGVLLGLLLALWARYLFGEVIALCVLVLYVFSPNILAHGSLITPDIMLTFTFFGAIYFCYRYVKFFKLTDILFCALFTAFTLLTKYSSVIILPLLLFWFLASDSKMKLKHGLLYAAFVVLVVLVFYRGNLTPYIDGFLFQYQKASGGHNAFLNGQYSANGWWNYYIYAFLYKTPLVSIMLFLGGIITMLVFVWGKMHFAKDAVAVKIKSIMVSDFAFLAVPVILFFALFTVKHNQCIGIRYLLPIYPFVFLICGYAFLFLFSLRAKVQIKNAVSLFLSLIIGVYVSVSLAVYPNYLTFFNFLGGGEDGYRKMVDSNLDWGQDLKGLALYCRENNIKEISLSYFGSDTPLRYGIRYKWLPSMMLVDLKNEGAKNYPPKGKVAISVTNLMGVYFSDKDIYKDIRENHKPIAKIGNTIYVYDIK